MVKCWQADWRNTKVSIEVFAEFELIFEPSFFASGCSSQKQPFEGYERLCVTLLSDRTRKENLLLMWKGRPGGGQIDLQ